MDEKTEKSFSRLKSFVLDGAQKQRGRLVHETEKKINTELEVKKAELMREAEKKLKSGLDAAKRESKTEILEKELAAKKELMACREEIINEVFDEVKKKIADYRTTAEYAEWLKVKAREAADFCGGNAIIYAEKQDIPLLSDIPCKKEARALLGGIIAENTERGIAADYSVDSLILESRGDFLRTGGLTIEI